MRRRGERNRPETVGGASASDNDSILFKNLDIELGEDGNAVIIAKLGEGDERSSTQIVKDEGGLRRRAEMRRERKETTKGGRHDVAASRENGRTVRNGNEMTEVDSIGRSNKSAGGTRIKKNVRRERARYRRER
jgi:hypothetical protein